MDQPPRCKHYETKDREDSESCANCRGWVSIQCLDHLTLLKEYETRRRFEEFDLMVRANRGVILD